MNLKTYAKKVSELAKKYPTAKVVFSSDEEGNSFAEVPFAPCPGFFDGFEFEPLDPSKTDKINSVCVN